jgi:glycosyltransferase involved in cell wall biosynthesis
MNPLLSVVIPNFNCASVIIRCLNSIDYSDAEIIVVDDGSTDDSAEVIMDYIATHPNVRLIRKENGGVSSARNAGIEEASGKYIMFVDADDYVVPGGIDRVLHIAEENEAEVLKFDFKNVMNDADIDTESIESLPCSTRVIEGRYAALKRYDVPDYLVWDGIYRRSIIMDNNIRFHTDLSLHEDDVFMGELYCHVNKVFITDLPLYRYVRCSGQSSTHNLKVEKQRRLIKCGYLAIEHRGSYVEKYCPEAMPMERLKYMRWLCSPKMAIEAEYSLQEYKRILGIFKEYGCYPLDYKWIYVAGFDWSLKVRMQKRTRTFLCNHPTFAYLFYKGRIK